MLVTLLGGLLGALTSLAPEIMRYFNRRLDHAHELAMGQIQIQAQRELAAQRVEEVRVQSEAQLERDFSAEIRAAVEQQAAMVAASGGGWVAAFGSLVRPVVTYIFVLTYVAVKFAQFTVLFGDGVATTWAEAMTEMWGEEDFAILAAILGYWFGGRALARHRQAVG